MILKSFFLALFLSLAPVYANDNELDCEFVELAIIPASDLEKILALAEPASIVVAQDEASLIKTVKSIPELKEQKVDVEFCLSNADFKDDFTGKYGNAVESLKKKYSQSVKDYPSEVCIDTALIAEDDSDLDILQTKFNSKKEVTIEIKKIINPTTIAEKGKDWETRAKLTLRAALLGAAGAAVTSKARDAIDYLSNKGGGKNITLGQGALIGAITDLLQRSAGRTNEVDIAYVNMGSAMVAGLLRTKDPNAVGLSIVLTAYQIPAVQKGLDKLAEVTPEKLDWKIPAALIGTFVILSKKQKVDPLLANKDKILGGATFGSLAYAISASKKMRPQVL